MSDENNIVENDDELDQAFEEFANAKSQDAVDMDDEPEQDESQDDNQDEQAQESEPESNELSQDDLKAELQKWQHKYNSDIGRVNAYQNQISQLQQQLADAQKAKTGDNPENSGMSDSEWETLKEDYPDIANALEKKLGAIEQSYQSQLKRFDSQLEPVRQSQQEQYRNMQLQALETAHSDWREVVQSDDYSQWLQSQPQEIQAFMQSSEADKNIYLLNSYKASKGMSQAPSNIQQKRNRQLQQSRTVPNRTTSNANRTIAEDDYDAAFDYYASKKDK